MEMTIGYSDAQICLMARNTNSSFIFWPRVFIFGTIIAYGVKITIGFSDHQCDLGVKGQGHIRLKSVKKLSYGSKHELSIRFLIGCLYFA